MNTGQFLSCFPDRESRMLWFANLSLRRIPAAVSSHDQPETLMPEPLIDLSNPESWRLLKQARKRGYLTREEFDQMFGSELPPDRMEALKRELWKLHITILVAGDKR
jgi:hypothetical protein